MQLEQPSASYGNPQLEDGHTRIANELLEIITRFDFSKRQLKIVLFIIRKTYGFNKKIDQMSISQLSSGTGLNASNVVKAITELVAMRVVSKQHGQYAQVIGLNKNYNTWMVVSKQHPSVKTTIKVVSKQPFASVKTTLTKETTKENTKRKGETLIPDDFTISERVKKWALSKGYDKLETHLENFILTAQAKSYKYTNWDSAFMKAIAANWAKVTVSRPRGLVN